MSNQALIPRSVYIVREAINHCYSHPRILFPFISIAFIQLFVLEVLYFSPQYPLAKFFGPVIKRLMGEIYLHYPVNYIILPKLFNYAQVPIYLFLSNFLIGVAIALLWAINTNSTTSIKTAFKSVKPMYVHIVIAAFISFIVYFGLYSIYGTFLAKSFKMAGGGAHFLKSLLLNGAPYFTLFIGVIVTTLFAFVLPLIVIEKKGILTAFWMNFRDHMGSFPHVFLLVFLPTLCYLPILLLRNNINIIADTTFPEMRLILLIISILISVGIDTVVYISITIYYLLKKEQA